MKTMTFATTIIATALSLYTVWRLTSSSHRPATSDRNFERNRFWSWHSPANIVVHVGKGLTTGAAAEADSARAPIRAGTDRAGTADPKFDCQVPRPRTTCDQPESGAAADVASAVHRSTFGCRLIAPELSLAECERLAIKVIKALGKHVIDLSADRSISSEAAEQPAGTVLTVLRRDPEFMAAAQSQRFRKLLLETLSCVELTDSALLLKRAITEKAAQLQCPLNEAQAAEVALAHGISEVRFTAIKELIWRIA